MKAIEILNWIVNQRVFGAKLNFINVPEGDEQTEEWWVDNIGGCPPHPISGGTYLYYFESEMEVYDMFDGFGAYREPDALIEIPVAVNFDYIYLYKIDDYE